MTALGPSIVIVVDDVDHAVIARIVVQRVAPHAAVSVLTDPRSVPFGLIEAPHGALVLMDRMLGGLDVTASLPAICTRRPDLRIVLLSSSLDERARLDALAGGAVSATEKPPTLAGWYALVSSLLDPPERLAAA